ncbi:MAG: hypothetical protein M0036_19345 [Desulfobacteraceae bacterium]|nr:hypothetical protein [Desulfobacteraceae bacterium]
MSDKEKKMAAALAAVSAYLQQEEEYLARQTAAAAPSLSRDEDRIQPFPAAAPASSQKTAPAPALNLWGQSGRQSMMQLRNLMQLRGFHRLG